MDSLTITAQGATDRTSSVLYYIKLQAELQAALITILRECQRSEYERALRRSTTTTTTTTTTTSTTSRNATDAVGSPALAPQQAVVASHGETQGQSTGVAVVTAAGSAAAVVGLGLSTPVQASEINAQAAPPAAAEPAPMGVPDSGGGSGESSPSQDGSVPDTPALSSAELSSGSPVSDGDGGAHTGSAADHALPGVKHEGIPDAEKHKQALRQELQTWLRVKDDIVDLFLDSRVMNKLWDAYYRHMDILSVATRDGLLRADLPSVVVDAIMAAQKKGA
jgi:hypothetical protein